MKKILYILLVFLLLCCDDFSFGIVPVFVQNNSSETLVVYATLNGDPGQEYGFHPVYPDTLLPEDGKNYYDSLNPILEFLSRVIVRPGEKGGIGGTDEYYHKGDLKKILPKDTLSVFIMSLDTIGKYGYEDVCKNYRILVRYDLSVDEVEDVFDFVFPYPPTPVMEEMKMFPPYTEVLRRAGIE